MLRIGLQISLCFVAVLLYAVIEGGNFHSPFCTLLGVSCPDLVEVEGYTNEKKGYGIMYIDIWYVFIQKFSQSSITDRGIEVVNLCGGHIKGKKDKPIREGLQNVFSVGKAITNIIIAILVDRGHLNYDEPIASYWPEFAVNNKENVTVTDLLQHSGGLTFLNPLIPYSLLAEDKINQLATFLSNQSHCFGGERKTAYHISSSGFYLNELIRRVDPLHRDANQFMQDEIASKLNVEFSYGLPEHQEDRYSPFYEYPMYKILIKIVPRMFFNIPFLPVLHGRETMLTYLNSSSEFAKAAPIFEGFTLDYLDSKHYRSVRSMLSANGFSNAHSIAKIAHTMSLDGEAVDGIKLIKNPKIIRRANKVAGAYHDLTFNRNFTYTYGGFSTFLNATGWFGLGGSLLLWDAKTGVTFSYVTNAKGVCADVDDRAEELYTTFLNLRNKI
ncbi:beta-lactamase domain-containing protein [Acrasis kona]|uniref:Beta-lactamase domain-containing protein n=1 Tax=Acrasis kona TaxID=1008807 RepID=A0AAW2Z6V8_9EUKA